MKKTPFLPVFSSISAMHRVFGDAQPSTEIHRLDNVLSPPLLARNGITTHTRTWFARVPSIGVMECKTRWECYCDGVLVDYTAERALIIKSFRWLIKMGASQQG